MGERSIVWDSFLRRWHPTQVVVAGFAVVILAGAVLLTLPVAEARDADHGLWDTLFTATSAGTVTGLTVVDTSTAWSGFGQVVILALVQVGGFGLMAVSSMVAVALAGKLDLRHRMAAQTEAGVSLGDLRQVLRGVLRWSLGIEAAVAVLLAAGFVVNHGEPPGRALWLGVFHAVSAFNNAGLALYPDNLERFVGDPWTSGLVSVAVVLGGIGFPVLIELRRALGTPRRWSVHTKVTLLTSAALFAAGTVAVLLLEWTNPATLGPLQVGDKLMAGWFHGVSPRTAGFNTVSYGGVEQGTLLVTTTLMFIGAASGSTGGGIKVTTFAVLGYAIWAEVRGAADVEAFRRRIPEAALRQALAVALLGVAAVVAGTIALISFDDVSLGAGLFEATSAFGTVGLSTGLTPSLGRASHAILVAMMFLGRVGPVTLVAALVLRDAGRRFRYPEERPLIG